MSIPALRLVETDPSATHQQNPASVPGRPRIGQILCNRGRLRPQDLDLALGVQLRREGLLGTVLCDLGLASEADILAALSQQFGIPIADLDNTPPCADLFARMSPDLCLELGVIPWRQYHGSLVIACAEPARREQICARLGPDLGPVEIAVAPASDIQFWIARLGRDQLAKLAETRCPPNYSCRSWAKPFGLVLALAIGMVLILAGLVFPVLSMWVLFALVVINLLAMTALRLTALAQQFQGWLTPEDHTHKSAPSELVPHRLPVVSILVPLYREEKILPKLMTRLATTNYPKELLDICLVLEEGDEKTQNAVRALTLPHWMRAITTPRSTLKTKPRAMNYALGFCRGTIIGIYDAEDAPEPDQIDRIVRRFQHAGPEIACIQAYLDYYNPRQNWLARCFTIEYAIWFRLVLQAVEKMRLPVPLGGTSVFFRRHALEDLGAWDAHNVTEDADLGMRLARRGYRCAFEPTTTYEEANCHVLPWVKQRSRWLKGYAMTWITHMRRPAALWRDLGPMGFLTFQVLLLGTLSSFLLAPAIWSFWLVGFGLTPAFAGLLPAGAWATLGLAYLVSEIIHLVLAVVATSGRDHRFLMPWVPTLLFYWPLGTIAAYKAIYELLTAPFYWDKTAHGISDGD